MATKKDFSVPVDIYRAKVENVAGTPDAGKKKAGRKPIPGKVALHANISAEAKEYAAHAARVLGMTETDFIDYLIMEHKNKHGETIAEADKLCARLRKR